MIFTRTVENSYVSDDINVLTGKSAGGTSGKILLTTDNAQDGTGDDMQLLVGTGDVGDVGSMSMIAGTSNSEAQQGGGLNNSVGVLSGSIVAVWSYCDRNCSEQPQKVVSLA